MLETAKNLRGMKMKYAIEIQYADGTESTKTFVDTDKFIKQIMELGKQRSFKPYAMVTNVNDDYMTVAFQC